MKKLFLLIGLLVATTVSGQTDTTKYSNNYVRVWPAINQISLEYERRFSQKHGIVLSGGYQIAISSISGVPFHEPDRHLKGIVSRLGWKSYMTEWKHRNFWLTFNAMYKYLFCDKADMRYVSTISEFRSDRRHEFAAQVLIGYGWNKPRFSFEVFSGGSFKYYSSNITVFGATEDYLYDPPAKRNETSPYAGINLGVKVGFGW